MRYGSSVALGILSGTALLASAGMGTTFRIQKPAICKALGIEPSACEKEVELLVEPTAREPFPRLRGQVQEHDQQGQLVRVQCEKEACLPFLVRVAGDAVVALQTMPNQAHAARAPIVIRAGDKLTLIATGDGMRVKMTVVSLMAGRIGDSIRVREYGGSRCLHSLVADRHTVVASF